MKQIRELDTNEKTRTDILILNTLKDVLERVEVLEEKLGFIKNFLLLIYVVIYEFHRF